MLNDSIRFTYLKTPLYRYTFKNRKVREWVERHAEGLVLNLFAGKYKLNCNEIRNDLRKDMPCDYHEDALEFVKSWGDHAEEHANDIITVPPFNTVILDPPYAYRKSMEMYDGAVSSPFNQIKNHISRILAPNGIVITFGYHSNVMGKNRGYKQEHVLLMSHGGAIHDTVAIIERKDDGISREEVSTFFPLVD